jgi:hypothetical protein
MDVPEQRRRDFAIGLESILTLFSVVLGLLHTWSGRYSMNLDGISYLDLGDSFFHRDWANALNAWWSPLYAWTLGVAVNAIAPSPRWEFPLVHLVNFFIFLLALGAFRFFLHRLLRWCHESRAFELEVSALPDWSLILLGYAVFLWTTLEVVSIYDVSPDLAVLGCVCLLAGALLSIDLMDNDQSPDVDQSPSLWRFVFLGLVLGLGYWIKTILLPLGVVALICAFLWNGNWNRKEKENEKEKHSSQNWRRGLLTAALIFLCTAAPLVLLLSREKGRFTIGETGRLNYARYVFPQMPWTNWQGEIPGGGIPAHPTREILKDPPVFEFDGPVAGTYPPWTDPSYWNEGIRPHFRLRPQLEIFASTVPSEIRVLLREQPGLIAGVIVLVLLSGRPWWAGMRRLWPLVAICVIGMAIYLPLVENDRYLAGYVLVLFLVVLAAVRLRSADQRVASYVAIAVFVTMAIGLIDLTVRYATHHLINPGAGPNSTIEDTVAAEQLAHWGARSGDKVAVISDGTGIYWARLAKLRIIAEVNVSGVNQRFWGLTPDSRQRVYDALSRTQARLVMARCPAKSVDGWEPVAGTGDCVFWLQERR